MIIDRDKHKQFYQDEFRAETEEFDKTFCSNAFLLLNHAEEMFVAQFVTFRNGEMVMKFSNNRNLPRKGEFLFSMLLPKDLRNYRNWKDKTYKDLYKERFKGSECVCIWHAPTEDKRYSLVGFSRVDLDFATTISAAPGVILVFAPQRPPIDYISNLYKITSDTYSPSISQILDANYLHNSWTPILVKQENTAQFIHAQLGLTDTIILQGPPGTGKTYMIAELCQKLCDAGKSVMVTALTNRALMEIAEKSFLKSMLQEGRVLKTNITADENKELPQLQVLKQIIPIPSSLILSTFYITSGFAADLSIEQPFDYIIMDEASQALTAMFAACKKMGKKNLWVGDVKQLAPITTLNKDRVSRYGYADMIEGFDVMTSSGTHPIYQLTKSYRFAERAASYTGMFYDGTLKANNIQKIDIPQRLSNLLSPQGGPTLVLTDMRAGEYEPKFAIALLAYLVAMIYSEIKTKKVAVLTCMKSTTRALQKAINQNVGVKKDLLIDTIARIQGLTTDITILLIPSTSYIRTLEPRLFNVATSRAKEHTIIIAARTMFEYPTIKPLVRSYLERLREDQCIYIPNPEINSTKEAEDLALTIKSDVLPHTSPQ